MKLKKIIKTISLLILINIMICNLQMCIAIAPSDVANNHWALRYINIGVDNEWIYLNSNNEFNPDEPATREHVVNMVINIWDEANKREKTFGDLIKDEISLDSYRDANSISADCQAQMKTAIKNGIINGYEKDGIYTIQPLGKITRAEMATILARIANIEQDTTKTINFKDQLPKWAETNISKMVQTGLVVGYEDGTFKSEKNITNAEVVTMLVRWVYGEDYDYIDKQTKQRLEEYTYTDVDGNIISDLSKNIPTERYNIEKSINIATNLFNDILLYKELPKDTEDNENTEYKDYYKNAIYDTVEFSTNDSLVFLENPKTESIYVLRGIVTATKDGITKQADVEIEIGDYGYYLGVIEYKFLSELK